jgi:hypothetical protein
MGYSAPEYEDEGASASAPPDRRFAAVFIMANMSSLTAHTGLSQSLPPPTSTPDDDVGLEDSVIAREPGADSP